MAYTFDDDGYPYRVRMINLSLIGLIAIPGALVINDIPQRQPLLPPQLELTTRLVWNPVVW